MNQRARSVLISAALCFFAIAVGFLIHRARFTGFDFEALDCAQVARNISEGRGFTTGVLRPLLLPLAPNSAAAFPEVTNAPLWPFLLGCVFSLGGARESVIIALSLGLCGLSTVLLFLLAKRLGCDDLTAALASAVFALTPTVLGLATSGRPLVLSTPLLILMLLALTPRAAAIENNPSQDNFSEKSASEKLSETRRGFRLCLIAGILAALCYLTDYVALCAVLPLAIVWGWSRGFWNRHTVLAFALGFALCALPWWVRNLRLFGNPFATSQWLELAMSTRWYPGLSAYRDVRLATDNAHLLHPSFEIFAYKFFSGLLTYFFQAPSALPMYFLPFALVSPWLSLGAFEMQAQRALKSGAALSTLGLFLGLALLGRISPLYLLPVLPLWCILGAEGYRALWARIREPQATASLRDVLAVCGLLAVLLIFPLWVIGSSEPPASQGRAERLHSLEMASPKGRVIATDAPAEVAWYTQRPALWLPQSPAQIPQVEGLPNRVPDAVYLSPAIAVNTAGISSSDEWLGVYSGQRELRRFTRAARPTMRDVLFMRDPTLKEAQTRAAAQPQNAGVQYALGQAALQAAKPQIALAAFARAQRLKPRWAAPHISAARAWLSLKKPAAARGEFQRALQIAPASVEAALGLASTLMQTGQDAQAIAAYEKLLVLAPSQPDALNNLAYLYAEKSADLERALSMAQRAVSVAPQNGAIWDTFGWVLLRAGRVPDAVRVLRRAVDLAPQNALAHYHLGKALLRAEKKKDAFKSFNQALSLGLPAKEQSDAQASF